MPHHVFYSRIGAARESCLAHGRDKLGMCGETDSQIPLQAIRSGDCSLAASIKVGFKIGSIVAGQITEIIAALPHERGDAAASMPS
jgi:hypothetical protein